MIWWSRQQQRRRHRWSWWTWRQQRATLVNVKLKWVKDRPLDSVVTREKHLRPAHHLLEQISSTPHLTIQRQHLPLLRRFPGLFRLDGPVVALTDDALCLRREELRALREFEQDLVDRLRRLLMLTLDRSLPVHTVQQLRWDMGLPHDFIHTLIPRHPHSFHLFQPPGDERLWVKLLHWEDQLAVSELEKKRDSSQNLAFPISFTRGFGLNRRCAAWLREWQTLPYTSPYADASGLDPRTDVSEKRIVGVFHELLHLTLAKKTERRNVSNLRKPLGLPQKFTKVFERHPGIFYLSQKLATQTVVLREAYGGGRQLLEKHPLVGVRERYAAMMRADKEEEEDERSDGTSDDCCSASLQTGSDSEESRVTY